MVEIVRVFAFGTLKKGFVLHQRGLAGARYCGRAQTRKAYPMVIAGQWFAPIMFDEPGTGSIVSGELYELSVEMLSKLDRLESVGQPGHFRKRIELETASGNLADAFAYSRLAGWRCRYILAISPPMTTIASFHRATKLSETRLFRVGLWKGGRKLLQCR